MTKKKKVAKKKPVKKVTKVTKVTKKTAKKKVVKKTTKKKKPVKKAKKPAKTYVTFVLDYSASMGSIRAETIEHVNEQIEQIQQDSKNMDTRISLITFNHEVNCVYFNQPLDRLCPLTLRTYRPSGMTAMYDAVGYAVNRMRAEFKDLENDPETAALVVIVSDGMENASKEFNQKAVAMLIDAAQKTERWTFSYLGANQDLSMIRDQLHIPKGNISAFVADSKGMQAATTMSVQSTSTYMKSRSLGLTSSQSYYSPKSSSNNK